MGVGVLAPHHCAKDASPPYEPRGGSAILGELDLCWSLARLPGCTRPAARPPAGAGVRQEPLRRADPPAAAHRAGGRGSGRAPARATATACWTAPRGKHRADPAQSPAPAWTPSPSSSGACWRPWRGRTGHRATTPGAERPRPGWSATACRRPVLALIKGRWPASPARRPAPKRGGRPPVRYAAHALGAWRSSGPWRAPAAARGAARSRRPPAARGPRPAAPGGARARRRRSGPAVRPLAVPPGALGARPRGRAGAGGLRPHGAAAGGHARPWRGSRGAPG